MVSTRHQWMFVKLKEFCSCEFIELNKVTACNWTFKAHTHKVMLVHADRISDRSPVGMIYWNVQV